MEPAMKLRKIPAGAHPDLLYPAYGSTVQRAPGARPLPLPAGATETTGPRFTGDVLYPHHEDLTKQVAGGEPLGQRIIVAGRVTDDGGRPVPDAMIELWQANAAGRYHHERDAHDAPLDPNFRGAGRVFTDGDGLYRFTSIKPGAYPWRNHANAWRPAHLHFSVFGRLFRQRLVTQMYFPGDPLFAYDPIFNAVRDPQARELLVARFDLEYTQPEWALAYEWDIVLGRGGLAATPMEDV